MAKTQSSLAQAVFADVGEVDVDGVAQVSGTSLAAPALASLSVFALYSWTPPSDSVIADRLRQSGSSLVRRVGRSTGYSMRSWAADDASRS